MGALAERRRSSCSISMILTVAGFHFPASVGYRKGGIKLPEPRRNQPKLLETGERWFRNGFTKVAGDK